MYYSRDRFECERVSHIIKGSKIKWLNILWYDEWIWESGEKCFKKMWEVSPVLTVMILEVRRWRQKRAVGNKRCVVREVFADWSNYERGKRYKELIVGKMSQGVDELCKRTDWGCVQSDCLLRWNHGIARSKVVVNEGCRAISRTFKKLNLQNILYLQRFWCLVLKDEWRK